jgi:ABC-2 type transport system permease protein
MKFTSIAVKDFKELIRDKRGLFFILLFPIFFMMIFGFAFGGMGQQNTPHNIAIVNYDEGTTLPTGGNFNFGNNLTNLIKESSYDNNDVKLFNVTETSESQADSLLKQRTVDAELIIPSNFSASMASQIANSTGLTNGNNTVSSPIIRGDEGYSNFFASESALSSVITEYQTGTVTYYKNQIAGTPGAVPVKYVNITVQGISGTQSFTQFDFLAPGMMVFAILLLATTIAAILTREVESGTLERLKMSKMRSFDLLFGGLIPWSLVAGAQVVILLIVAVLLGLHWQGGITSVILATIIGIIGGVASIALAMIIASFAKNDRQAANLGTLIVVPISFLVGAFFPLPQVFISVLGHSFQVYELIPWTHTLNALRGVLLYGEGLNAVAFQIELSLILTVILFIIGVFLYSRTRLRADN